MDYKVIKKNAYTNSDIFNAETNCHLYTLDGEFYVSGAKSLQEAQSLLDAHNPPAPEETTIAQKLASVGLSVDDLKAALGL